MSFLLYSIHILVCLFLILVVLLQQGKGADLSVFGGGGTMTAFGARGAATVLHKLTVISFVLFIVTTLSIGVIENRGRDATVMSGVEAEADADSAVPGDVTSGDAVPADELPLTEDEVDEAAEEPAGAFSEDAPPPETDGDETTAVEPAEASDGGVATEETTADGSEPADGDGG